MTKEDIIEKCKANKNLYKETVFKKHFIEHYEDLSKMSFPEDFSFQQKLYHWMNNISESPLCPSCGSVLKFLNPVLGYRKHCSVSCSRKDKDVQAKMKQTCLKKYGDETYNNREKSVKTRSKTFAEHGDEITKKSKQTRYEKYGDENYHNAEKAKLTNLKKYGSESPFGNSYIIEKSKKTKAEKYGNENYHNAEKAKLTNLEKYGSESPFGNEKVKGKIRETNLERYGVDNVFKSDTIKEKIRETNLERYGAENAFGSSVIKEKIRETNLERYGVEHPMQYGEIKEKLKNTNLRKYGVEYPMQSDEIKEKAKNNNLEKHGVSNISQLESTKEKINNTCLEKYNVLWPCQIPAVKHYCKKSKPNKIFAALLDKFKINYEQEFPLGKYSYDFKIDDILIEVNPTITHNSYLDIFGNNPKDKDYHYNKTSTALCNKYQCIHIWDWDDILKVVDLLKPKETLYARNLILKEVPEKECDEFLNLYHIQNTCKGQKIRYGLYKGDTLVQVMTFGKPRYNKNYELELLRLCNHKDYEIVGGAERLFKYILDKFKPENIISYCDNSKFNGNVYEKIGFIQHKSTKPSKHWYNCKTKQHITDDLLRQRGFDQLFNTNYGKGASNEELMIEYDFLPVYDAGQTIFTWNKIKQNPKR